MFLQPPVVTLTKLNTVVRANALIICFQTPLPDTPRDPRGNGTVLVFPLSLWGRGVVLKTTLMDHGDIPTGFVQVLVSGVLL